MTTYSKRKLSGPPLKVGKCENGNEKEKPIAFLIGPEQA